MNVSREPVVWRNAIAGVLLALVQVGVLTQPQVAVVDGWVTIAAPTATVLVPILAALWARKKTVPTATALNAPAQLTRGADGVYRTGPENTAHEMGTA